MAKRIYLSPDLPQIQPLQTTMLDFIAPPNADQAEFKILFTFLEIPFAEVDAKPTPLPVLNHAQKMQMATHIRPASNSVSLRLLSLGLWRE
jgi:hypothetical protein